jgi:hypothetical protein
MTEPLVLPAVRTHHMPKMDVFSEQASASEQAVVSARRHHGCHVDLGWWPLVWWEMICTVRVPCSDLVTSLVFMY